MFLKFHQLILVLSAVLTIAVALPVRLALHFRTFCPGTDCEQTEGPGTDFGLSGPDWKRGAEVDNVVARSEGPGTDGFIGADWKRGAEVDNVVARSEGPGTDGFIGADWKRAEVDNVVARTEGPGTDGFIGADWKRGAEVGRVAA
jgi:uncharacterized protein YfdQ (DUF2303 family)